MSRNAFVCALLFLLPTLSTGAAAQDVSGWSPASRSMPTMPRPVELGAGFMASAAAWMRGAEEVTGVPLGRLVPVGEGSSAGGRVGFVRFSDGRMPVAAWSDRNGDGRCDLVVLYRGSRVAAELIDVNYDGMADVVRTYDASGALLRETRLP
jgi:hypothetical protein